VNHADFLRTTVAATRRLTDERRTRESLHELERRAAPSAPRGEEFESALRIPGRVNIIAECKRRSPSRGALVEDYDVARIARAYERGGAAAISVLTEPRLFDGELAHLTAARRAVRLPLLRKDFIVDEYQLFEARAGGADAVLLIAAALEQRDLTHLHARALEIGLAALVEVHDEDELSRALDAGARLVGVNNRSLRTLEVSVETSVRLAARIPVSVTAVSESGLQSREELARLRAIGYRAFLIGERLMTDPDPARALAELISSTTRASSAPFLKVCGITRLEDALHAAECGATAIGFVFWPRSPRYISPERARGIIAQLPPGVTAVGVFVNESPERIRGAVVTSGISTVQLHGDEPPTYADAVQTPLLRSVTLDDADDPVRAWPADTTLLLDATDRERRGGTGTLVDWTRAAALARLRRTVLAGGLTPANVAEAIAAVRPFGVDVSSGVEDAPGVKNPAKVSRFLENAWGAFART
jgi:indole-3-glycerol phosphate synthase/phosphoribosylanthranilate isomerase